MIRKLIITAPLACALLASVPLASAMASPDGDGARQAEARRLLMAAPVNAAAAVTAVQGAGYSAVRDVEWARDHWRVKASDAAGRNARLRVDATTGAVTPRSR